MDRVSALSNGNEGTSRWSLRVLGGFELGALPGGERVALPGKRERVLLAYLAVSPNCRASRRKLATLLWGDATDETALDNMRTCVWGLRKALGDTKHRIIASEGEDIVLGAAAFEIDALTFRKLAAQSGKEELEEAAKLYAGEFLAELGIDNDEFESWRREEAGRFKDQALDVLKRLMAQLAEAGETERAIEVGTRIWRLEPLHETAVRHLMRLYGGSGRRAAAIQLYRTLAETLKTELDAQPEAETRAMFAEITRGGEETPAPTAAEAKPLPPTSIATPSVGPQSPPPPMPELAQEGPAIGAAQKVVPPQARKRPLGWIVAGGLAAAIALFLLYQFAGPVAQPTGIEAAKTASSSPAGTVAIAVLPFVNLSSDPEQEFFSDGMTEEITSALAKVPDLRVVGRTSAFQFKGQNQDLRAIGKSLAATHLIEGSVRKTGNRLRITAQLIKADDGTHIWAEDYDRELTDVFAIQEDIARAITTALRMPLGLKPSENLVSNRNIDPELYQQYLRARALNQAAGRQQFREAMALLEQVVARNPEYAPAWAMLGFDYGTVAFQSLVDPPDESRRIVDAFVPKAEAAIRRAIQLDPNLPEAYATSSSLENARGKVMEAEDLMLKALALDPDNPNVLSSHSFFLAKVGRLKEAMPPRLKLQSVEPFVPGYNAGTALLLWVNGQNDAALAMFKALPTLGALRARGSARIYATTGRYGEAADALQGIPARQVVASPVNLQEAVRLLRSGPASVSSADNLRSLDRLSWVYLYVGAPEQSLQMQERMVDLGLLTDEEGIEIWHPDYAPVRKTERFKAFARKAGLVDYWRARGWPDLCRPMGADDFVCG